MKQKLLNFAATATSWLKSNQIYMVYALTAALVLFAEPAFASDPILDIDFSSALQTIFDYASLMFVALLPISAVGIGLRFGSRLLEWVGDMIGKAF